MIGLGISYLYLGIIRPKSRSVQVISKVRYLTAYAAAYDSPGPLARPTGSGTVYSITTGGQLKLYRATQLARSPST